MRANLPKSQSELPSVRSLLDMAFDTLDDLGVTSYKGLYVYVCGYRNGKKVQELSVENGLVRLSPPRSLSMPLAGADTTFDERQPCLIMGLCRIIQLWQWKDADIAAYLGSGTFLMSHWISLAKQGENPMMPRNVADRIHRLLAIEHLRLAAGVTESEVSAWAKKERLALRGRSLLKVLQCDGDIGFRSVQLWLLTTTLAENATVH